MRGRIVRHVCIGESVIGVYFWRRLQREGHRGTCFRFQFSSAEFEPGGRKSAFVTPGGRGTARRFTANPASAEVEREVCGASEAAAAAAVPITEPLKLVLMSTHFFSHTSLVTTLQEHSLMANLESAAWMGGLFALPSAQRRTGMGSRARV